MLRENIIIKYNADTKEKAKIRSIVKEGIESYLEMYSRANEFSIRYEDSGKKLNYTVKKENNSFIVTINSMKGYR